LAGYKNGDEEDLEMHDHMETNVQGVSESGRLPMVQLSGRKSQDAAGDRVLLKKLKLGLPSWRAGSSGGVFLSFASFVFTSNSLFKPV
jgi:hypothetical protein